MSVLTGKFWDEKFAGAGFAYGSEPSEFVVEKCNLLPEDARVLVPGDGEGRNGVALARMGFHVVTVDASSTGVRKALALAEERGVEIDARVADLAEWVWPQRSFDAVISVFLHLPPEIRASVHRSMAQALEPGGLLIIEGFSMQQLDRQRDGNVGGPTRPDMLFTRDILIGDFDTLEPLEIHEGDVHFAHGGLHKGHGSVVRAVFRKPASSDAPLNLASRIILFAGALVGTFVSGIAQWSFGWTLLMAFAAMMCGRFLLSQQHRTERRRFAEAKLNTKSKLSAYVLGFSILISLLVALWALGWAIRTLVDWII